MKKLLLTCACVCLSVPALAEDQLTEDAIRDFYKQAAEALMADEETAVAHLEKHFHEDVKLTMITKMTFEDIPPMESLIIYDKKTYISDTRFSYKTGKTEKIESEILSLEIAPDGKSAKVSDKTHIYMAIELPTPSKTEIVSTCDDEIILNDEAMIQVKDVKCNLEMEIPSTEAVTAPPKPDQPSLSAP